MGRYEFQSVGGAAGNAIEEFLVKRDLLARQHMLDQLAQQKQHDEQAHAHAQLSLQRDQETRIAKAQEQSQADLEKERAFRRASTIHANALPGPLDQPTADLLRGEGFGDIVQQGPSTQGAPTFDPTQINDVPAYDVVPGILQTAGGTAYQQARTSAAERAAQSREASASADARASEANQTREYIQRVAAAGQGDSRALRNQLTQMQIDREKDKLDTAAKEKQNQQATVAMGRAKVRDLATSLINDPELEGITGTVQGRRDTFFSGPAIDAYRRLKQLVSSLSVEERGKLKGQGQVSDYEGKLLANAVSAIDRAAGPDIVKQHLQEIVNAFQGDTPSAGHATGGGGNADPLGIR
jgi:hypothetical protein